MKYNNINISNVEDKIAKTVKEQIKKIMNFKQYLEADRLYLRGSHIWVPITFLNFIHFIYSSILACPNIRQLTIYIILLPALPVILSAIIMQLYATIISPTETS